MWRKGLLVVMRVQTCWKGSSARGNSEKRTEQFWKRRAFAAWFVENPTERCRRAVVERKKEA